MMCDQVGSAKSKMAASKHEVYLYLIVCRQDTGTKSQRLYINVLGFPSCYPMRLVIRSVAVGVVLLSFPRAEICVFLVWKLFGIWDFPLLVGRTAFKQIPLDFWTPKKLTMFLKCCSYLIYKLRYMHVCQFLFLFEGHHL